MDPRHAARAGMPARLAPRQVDWLAFAAATGLSLLAVASAAANGAAVAVSVAVLPVGTVPLLWRRDRPVSVLVAAAAAFAVGAIFEQTLVNAVALLFAAYAAALYGKHRVRVAGGVIATGVLAAAFGALLASGSGRTYGHLSGVAVSCGIAWVLGEQTRTRRAYLAELEDRAARLERDRDLHARRAAEEERNRIARELHDVVVHHVGVIAVQAGAARSTLPAGNEAALHPLGLIERTARTALSELRALLGVLRKSDPSAPLRPQPTFAQLDHLIGAARDAGIHAGVRVEGDIRPLASVVDLCAYRIVQEALTNTIKHAPNANVHVLVRYGPRDLHITVVDDGPVSHMPAGTGHGLIGMRERAALVDGQVEAGPTPGGGFRVEAHLPLGDTDTDLGCPPPALNAAETPHASTERRPA